MLTVGIVGFSSRSMAQAPAPLDWTAITASLDRAALADDANGVKAARVACLRLLSTAPSSPRPVLIRYAIAYAGWRLAFSPSLSAKEQDDLLIDAESQLTQAVKADGTFAEAYGLLSLVYGARIGKNGDLGATLG